MKKFFTCSLMLLMSTLFFSFSANRGGDFFEVYLNGRQMHQQFMHVDKGVKTLSFASVNDNDKIEVLYSHCGVSGKSRVLSIRNEKNEVLKEIRFKDTDQKRSLMGFYRKDIPKKGAGIMNVYYTSKELPEGKLLTSIAWKENKATVKL